MQIGQNISYRPRYLWLNVAIFTVVATILILSLPLFSQTKADAADSEKAVMMAAAQVNAAATTKILQDRLDLAGSIANGVRTFGSYGDLGQVPCLARQQGFSVVAAGAFLQGDATNDTAEIQRLKDNVRKGCVTVAVLGTNPTTRGWSVNQLINEITSFKEFTAETNGLSTPVTVAERYEVYRDNPALINAVDVVFISVEPFYEGPATGQNGKTSPSEGVSRVKAAYKWFQGQYPNKKVVIVETGWPSDGPDVRATTQNEVMYHRELLTWAADANVPIFAYSLADEPELASYNPYLAHFGIATSNGALKPGMENIFTTNCRTGKGNVIGTLSTTQPTKNCYVGVNFVAPVTSVSMPTPTPVVLGSSDCQLSGAQINTALRNHAVGINNANLAKINIGLSGVTGVDSDGDGLPDVLEQAIGTNPKSTDTDHDGYSDRAEIEYGYSPVQGNGARLPLNTAFATKESGKMFLAVQQHGAAWFVSPTDHKRYLLTATPESRSVAAGWLCQNTK